MSTATETSDTFYDRFRLIALIAAIEDDLRRHLRLEVAPWNEIDQVFGDRLQKVVERAAEDGVYDAPAEILLDYIDFGDGFALLNEHRRNLPTDLGTVVRALTPRFEASVPIRNRLMHGRPYRSSDEEDIAALGGALSGAGAEFPRTGETLRRLNQDPNWSPIVDLQSPAPTGMICNLPLPEFEETGLLGRDAEVNDVIELLTSRRRNPVVTITGEGGIGKTALAVATAYELLERVPDHFTIILWASLKTERLSGLGVESIPGAPTDLSSLLTELGDAITESADLVIADLAALLDGERTLIIIDNAESIHPSHVLTLADTLPDASFLITSRVALGQLERRVDLGPLRLPAAKHMLRSLARKRRIQRWARANEAQLDQVVGSLRQSPLAIRWFLEAVDAGAEPDQLLSDQSTLLQFCMSTIYDTLDLDAQRVVQCLLAIDNEATIGRVALLAELDRAVVHQAMLELQRRAIVAPGSLQANHAQSFVVADTAAEYLRRFADSESSAARTDLQQRLREIGASDEARRRYDRQSALHPFNIAAETPEEQAAAAVLRNALRASKAGDLDEANRCTSQAIEALPTFFEAFRVSGFIQSRGRPQEAQRSYEEAYRLAPPERKPHVAYWMSGHLANMLRDVDAAVPLAEEAHEALGLPETAERLGRMRMYHDRWDEAEALFSEAATADVARLRSIAETDLLDLAKRRMEDMVATQRNPLLALEIAVTSARRGLAFARNEVVDRRLESAIADLYSEAFRVLHGMADLSLAEDTLVELLEDADRHLGILLRGGTEIGWDIRFAALSRQAGLSEDLKAYVEKILTRLTGDGPKLANMGGEGFIVSFNGDQGYGFVRPVDGGDNVFFHISALDDPLDVFFLVRDGPVAFVYEDGSGADSARPRADSVSSRLPAPEKSRRLEGRRVVVVRSHPTYAFAEDATTRGTVFVSRAALRQQRDWDAVGVGTMLTVDVESGDRGPRARTRSGELARDD